MSDKGSGLRGQGSGKKGLRRGAVILLLPLWGCSGPFLKPEDYVVGPPLSSLRDIESIDLKAQSKAGDMSVEEATENAIETLLERKPPPATAEIDLAEVRAASLANNLDLKVQLVDPAIADQTVRVEEAKFEATFFGSARRTEFDQPVQLATESSQGTIDSVDLGVRLPLRTGGTITLDTPFGSNQNNNLFIPAGTPNPAYDAAVRFSISQPLLRGGGIKTNTASILVARSERKIVNAQTKLESIRILANADRAYWLVFAARRQLEVRQQQYDLAMEQLEQARRKVAAGEAAEIESTRAESGVASSIQDIIVADTILRRRERDLKRIMNLPDLTMDSPTALIPTTMPDPVFLDLDPIALGEFAVDNRMEMLELELRLSIDASNVDFEKNAALPLFTVDYTYSLNGLSGNLGGAYGQVFDNNFQNWTLGLNVEIPIGNEAAKARVSRAILVRLQRLATRDLRRLAILQEVYDAVDLLNQEWQRILAARQAVIFAARTYEGERRQFEVGLRTSTDVLDAAARLADAQSSEVSALADYEIARVDIAFGTGTLLGHGHVEWEPTEIDNEAKDKDEPVKGRRETVEGETVIEGAIREAPE